MNLEDNLTPKGCITRTSLKQTVEQDLYKAVTDWENLRKGVDIKLRTTRKNIFIHDTSHFDKQIS